MKELTFRVRDFNPVDIFECGQCFRWEALPDESYLGIVSGRVVRLEFRREATARDAGTLILHNAPEEDRGFWHRYFDLDRDYGALKRTLAEKDPILDKAVSFGSGLRILRQDPWETLVSFIISANNNIPRIKKNIECLAREHGSFAAGYLERDWYNIPDPEALAALTEEDLAPCRLGYRAGYLVRTAAVIQRRGMEGLGECLGDLPGVGPKVASCIRLFGLGDFANFPVDVWMRKAMSEFYGFDPGDTKGMDAFAKETFGDAAGIAQQYLFYYIRNRKEHSC